MRKSKTAFILGFMVMLLSCMPAEAAGKPSVAVNHKEAVICKGNSVQLVPALKHTSSKIKSKIYKSSNKKVASVSKNGTVKGKKAGSAVIIVTVNTKNKKSFTRKVKITVKNAATSKTPYLSISGDTKVSEGNKTKLSLKLKNSKSVMKSMTYKSSNTKIAKVSPAGEVTGVKDGTAVITATSKTKDKHTLVKTVKIKVSTSLKERVAGTKTAKKTNQIITAASGKLTLWEKSGNTWKSVLSTSCKVGRNGISSSKKEGDGKTPAGSYSIPLAFGLGDDPGTKLDYRKITKNSYWISNTSDKNYNTWQERTKSSSKDEHLIKYSVYKYAMVVNYNASCKPGKGSAIFIHCTNGKSTAGCISVPESKMLSLMKKVEKGAYIIIAGSEAKFRTISLTKPACMVELLVLINE